MSMSTHVIGFHPADEEWLRMKAAYEACEKARVDIPDEVDRFFGYEPPGNRPGREVELKGAIEKYAEDSREGFQVDLSSCQLLENHRKAQHCLILSN